jgi:glycosyltransferase involved in cell wall biosynthesis
MKQKLILLFDNIEVEHFGKDTFLIPYYLGKIYELDVTIVYPQTETNKCLPKKVRGVKLHPLKSITPSSIFIYRTLVFLLYVIRNIQKIDILMQIHIMHQAAIIGSVYKLLKPKGILYVKGDGIGVANVVSEQWYMQSKNIKDYMIKQLFIRFLEVVDVISVETDEDYSRLCKNKIFGVDLAHKTRQIYNGFDEDLLSSFHLKVNGIAEKKNIILTVGRLGSSQKNTEMLLEAAKMLDWKDWKMLLAGNIEKKECDFQQIVDTFFLTNPYLREKVLFTGAIYDKEELWKLHNDAKVFVLTSRYEGFANVYADAVRFRNYIISTDVGGANEMIRNGYGALISQNNVMALARSLQKIIDSDNYLDDLYHKIRWMNLDVSWERYIRDAIKLDSKHK